MNSHRVHMLVLALSLLGATHWMGGQIQSGAPIRDFRLPKFDENGRLEWDFAGTTGIYRSSDQVDVEGVRLRVFSDDAPPKEIFQMQSRAASIFVEEGRAMGKGAVYGTAEEFVISGDRWEWIAKIDTLIIEEDVRVIFNQALSNLLN